MRMIRNVIIPMLLLLSFCACEPIIGNYGYPHSVSLRAAGDSIIVSGDEGFHFLSIAAGSNTVAYDTVPFGERDTIIAKYQWLKVKFPLDGNCNLIFIAQPNNTNKKRTLYVYGSVGDHDAEIKVTQNSQ